MMRGSRPVDGGLSTHSQWSEHGSRTPRRHDQPDEDQEHRTAAAKRARGSGRSLTSGVLPPGVPVAEHQCQPQTEDHLSEDGVEAENLEHDCHGSVAQMRHCYVLRVFTRNGIGGNALGVVTDVSGLSDGMMQDVASDLGFPETIFVDWRGGGVPRTRIFTPTAELPFAGHPMVGAAWVVNVLGPGNVASLECAAGDVRIHTSEDVVVIESPDTPREVRAAELDDSMAGWVDHVSVYTVTMPLEFCLIEARSPEVVAAADRARSGTVLLWAWDGSDVKARFFAPDLGVPEDPATGGAAVALANVLYETGRTSGSINILQGDEMGSPSTILVEWNGPRVSLGGRVVRDETRELDV